MKEYTVVAEALMRSTWLIKAKDKKEARQIVTQGETPADKDEVVSVRITSIEEFEDAG
jgi:autonomous glycyl radical cofactor GrcA